MLRDAPPRRRVALLIRGPPFLNPTCRLCTGPGSAKQRCALHRVRDTRSLGLTAFRPLPPICPSGKSVNFCLAPLISVQCFCQKFSACAVGQITATSFGRPALFQEGRFAVVTNVGCGMRWTPSMREDDAHRCGRRSRVVLTSRRWCQAGDDAFASRRRRWQESPAHRGEHEGIR